MANAKELKDAFLEATQESMNNGNSNIIYTFDMIVALYDMAKADVYPDGRFGDLDCNVWSLFHREINR